MNDLSNYTPEKSDYVRSSLEKAKERLALSAGKDASDVAAARKRLERAIAHGEQLSRGEGETFSSLSEFPEILAAELAAIPEAITLLASL